LQWDYGTGMIVFLPVGTIAYLGAMPVTWWQIRGHDPISGCLEIGIVSPDLPTRSHWKRGLVWFCAVAALLAALLLPWPLFLYCCDRGGSKTWTAWVLENTPVFIADTAAGALTLSSHEAAVDLYQGALAGGRVSKKRLLAELNSSDPTTQKCAFAGLERSDLQAALAVADQIGQTRTSGTASSLPLMAGYLMARFGTRERIRYFLAQAAIQSPPASEFVESLLRYLPERPESLPELVSFCRKDSPYRGYALVVLTKMLPAMDVPGVWLEFLADSDPLRRQQALNVIPDISDANARLAILAAGFESPNPLVLQALKQQLWFLSWVFSQCKSSDPALIKRLVQSVLSLLDDADRTIRCAAACSLYWLVDDHGTLQKAFDFPDNLYYRLASGQPGQATPEEQEVLESVRAAAKKWLDEHK
ncbi:MAG: hypothetical protein ABSE73_27605, partial [Planctomycetota bacterium]